MMKRITTVMKRTMTTTQRTIMTYQRTIQMWKISDGSKALTVHFGNDFENDFEDDYWRHCHWGSLIRNLWMQQSDSPLPSSGNIQTKWKEKKIEACFGSMRYLCSNKYWSDIILVSVLVDIFGYIKMSLFLCNCVKQNCQNILVHNV